MTDADLTQPAKLLLMAALLAKDGIITNNAKAFLKELVLSGDQRYGQLLQRFESKEAPDSEFVQSIHALIGIF